MPVVNVVTSDNNNTHQFSVGNLSASLLLSDERAQGQSPRSESLEISLRNLEGYNIGKIILSDLTEFGAGELFQDLVHSGSRLLSASNGSNSQAVYPPEALKKIIDRAGSFGAIVESENFGEESQEIVKRYQALSVSTMSHRVKIINVASGKTYTVEKARLTEKLVQDQKRLVWVDISADLEMSDLEFENLEDLLVERFPGLKQALLKSREDEKDIAFLETRVFSRDPKNQFRVIRDKFYALVGANILVTVHDKELPAIESLWQATDKKCSDKHSNTITLALKILDNVYKQNEKVVRRLERGADKMQDRQSQLVAGKERQVLLDNVSTLERTARFIQRKATDTHTSLQQLAALLDPVDDSENPTNKHIRRAIKEHQALLTNYSDLKGRATNLLSQGDSIRETNSAAVAGYSNNVNEKLTKLGALFAPAVTALSSMEVFPELIPYWRVILGGSVFCSAALLWGLHKVTFWKR